LPGKQATRGQIERFWNLVEGPARMSPRSAAKKVGMSESWGWRMSQGVKGSANSVSAYDRKVDTDVPSPKSKEELRPAILDMLRPSGFNDFCEAFLTRRPAAWRAEAVEEIVGYIVDRTEKSYIDINTPPGIGKTTLFTHDFPLWLICGGGYVDPLMGRAIRILLGHEVKKVSIDYVRRLRRSLDLTRPFYDKEQKRSADLVITDEFGRFKPLLQEGEEKLWQAEQFLVAQLASQDLYEKEPTVQAASYQGGFLGERVDFYSWDDLATTKNSRSPDQAENLDRWFEDEAETRLEPGGVGLLVGQRLGPLDLHRKRLDKTWTDDEGDVHAVYEHIVLPAHNEQTCDDQHRQWDLKADGCLLDESRLSWRDILKVRSSPNFRTVYQQEDADPGSVLVLPVWLDGGMDPDGFDAPGCWDKDRGFWELPNLGSKEKWITYACVDPSASNWWVIEVWATRSISGLPFKEWPRYLLYGHRAKLQAGGPGGFLDWDSREQKHVGWMERLQQETIQLGIPIRVWVIEANAAHRHVMQYDHFRTWRDKYPWVKVIPHQTQRNKNDEDLGVEARLRMTYRNGLKRLPRSPKDPSILNYMKIKVRELTTYPSSPTDDTVLCDWFGEHNFEVIVRTALTPSREGHRIDPSLHLPPYLRRQRLVGQLNR
jgi:hypothetical protein